MAKKYNRKRTKKIEKKRVNKYTALLGTFALIIILLLVFYYSSFIQASKEPERYQEIQTPTTTETETIVAVEGNCKRDSECFITYCINSEKDCVNTTQLTDYNKKCRSYSEWKVDKQDASKCGCVQNSCTMK